MKQAGAHSGKRGERLGIALSLCRYRRYARERKNAWTGWLQRGAGVKAGAWVWGTGQAFGELGSEEARKKAARCVTQAYLPAAGYQTLHFAASGRLPRRP